MDEPGKDWIIRNDQIIERPANKVNTNSGLVPVLFGEHSPIDQPQPTGGDPPLVYTNISTRHLSILYYNARSLLPKYDALKANCLVYNPDIICIVVE